MIRVVRVIRVIRVIKIIRVIRACLQPAPEHVQRLLFSVVVLYSTEHCRILEVHPGVGRLVKQKLLVGGLS